MAGSRRDVTPPLRSLSSDEPTYVDFVNESRRPARAWWLNFCGRPVSYGDIEPGGSMKMNTFLTHPWIFRTSECRSRLRVNTQDVFFPSSAVYEDGYPVYVKVCITSPVYSLKDCCTTVIRKKVKKEDFVKLEIPECLQKDLAKTPNLLEELKILNLHFRANDQ
ncbi:von Hippel-Lindau-like protein [Scleropages formosus]|uniref:von Hippel-Lindau disease tumor suppressor n=1 Tax=Scleropages formosus TaxID=113540 RepID=A0A8C9UXJ0_SCLFO|nr:von Hippel-Lindau disease tumor suppressor-like [Scleropages formosus]